jgi:hypothetical protein
MVRWWNGEMVELYGVSKRLFKESNENKSVFVKI